jgi:S1-C subfamily serine protease
VEANTGVDITKPLTPVPYSEERANGNAGSGFFCTADGKMITNMHVVERAIVLGNEITVKMQDGSEYLAKVLAADPRRDVALIQVINPNGRKFKTLHLVPDSEQLRQGDVLAAFGNPRLLEGTLSIGHLSAKNRLQKTVSDFSLSKLDESVPLHQITVPIAPGNSGGEVTLMNGLVAGINQSYKNEPGSMNFMVPANAIADFMAVYNAGFPIEGAPLNMVLASSVFNEFPRLLNKLEQALYIARQAELYAENRQSDLKAGNPPEELKKMPVDKAASQLKDELKTAKKRVQEAQKTLKQHQEWYQKASANAVAPLYGGLIVTEVTEKSSLEKAGLKPFDVITHLNGEPVKSTEIFIAGIKGLYTYQDYEITVRREGQSVILHVLPEPVKKTR